MKHLDKYFSFRYYVLYGVLLATVAIVCATPKTLPQLWSNEFGPAVDLIIFGLGVILVNLITILAIISPFYYDVAFRAGLAALAHHAQQKPVQVLIAVWSSIEFLARSVDQPYLQQPPSPLLYVFRTARRPFAFPRHSPLSALPYALYPLSCILRN